MSIELDDIPALKTVLTPVVYRMVKEKYDNRVWIVIDKDYYDQLDYDDRIVSVHRTEEGAKRAYINRIEEDISYYCIDRLIENEFKKCEDKLKFIEEYRGLSAIMDRYGYYEYPLFS